MAFQEFFDKIRWLIGIKEMHFYICFTPVYTSLNSIKFEASFQDFRFQYSKFISAIEKQCKRITLFFINTDFFLNWGLRID